MTRAAVGLAVCVLALLAWPNLWTTVDDAWISARYADHLAHGYGLTYSVDGPPVEGFTNLGWVLLLALGLFVGLPPDALLVGAGLCFGLLLVPTAVRLARELGVDGTGQALVAALVALDLHVALSSTNGLETSLFAWLVLIGAGAVVRGDGHWTAGLAATVRPEGLWVALGAAVRASTWRGRAMPMVGPVAVAAWRWATFGTLVPNSFRAKSLDPWMGRMQETLRLQAADLWWWVPVTLVLLGVALRGRPPARAVALVGLLLLGSTLTVAEWMPAGRLWVPAGVLALSLVPTLGPRAPWALLGPIAVLLSPLHTHLRAYDRQHSVLPQNDVAVAIRHVVAHVPAGETLVIRDAGVAAFWWGAGNPVVETHEDALTVAHGEGRADPLRRLPARPAVVVTTVQRADAEGSRYGNDQLVLRRVGRHLRPLGRVLQHRNRYYDLYLRADLDVPPLPVTTLPAPPPVATRHGPSRPPPLAPVR